MRHPTHLFELGFNRLGYQIGNPFPTTLYRTLIAPLLIPFLIIPFFCHFWFSLPFFAPSSDHTPLLFSDYSDHFSFRPSADPIF